MVLDGGIGPRHGFLSISELFQIPNKQKLPFSPTHTLTLLAPPFLPGQKHSTNNHHGKANQEIEDILLER